MDTLLTLILFFVPLALVLWLANMADKQRQQEEPQQAFAVATYLLLALLWVILFLFGLGLSAVGLLIRAQPLSPEAMTGFVQAGMSEEGVAQLLQALPMVGMGMWLPALLGMILLLPPLRRLVARFTNIDPASATHAVALSYTMLIIVNLWVTVGFGLGNLADLTEAGGELDAGSLTGITWGQELIFVVLAVIGVGWLARRDWRQALNRLGIVAPTLRQTLIGIGLGVLAMLLLIPLEYFMNATGLGVNEDVARLGEQFIGPLTQSIFGIITLGVAAALGEEAIFRGAMQPKFGLILTSLLFALLHSNYGITISTAIVFALGLVLGVVRNRTNTSTAMIVHAVYNMSIGLMSYLSLWPES